MATATTTLETARSVFELVVNRLPGGEVAAGTDNLNRIDYAIKAAGDEFVRRTKCVRKTNDTLTLTADDEDFDTSSLSDFDPSRLIKIEVEHPTDATIYPARRAAYDTVRTWRRHGIERNEWYPYTNSADYVGIPAVFGWRDKSNAIVAPLPAVAWKVLLTYWEPFSSWTIGTGTPGSVTLNIPDDLIMPVIHHGARSYFNMATNPASASLDRQLFEKHIMESRGFYGVSNQIQAQVEDYI